MEKLALPRRQEPTHLTIGEPELIPALTKRLDELCDRQDRFDRVVKELRLEWDEMYDKMRLLFARASKRIKDAANAEPEAPEQREDPLSGTIHRAAGYEQLKRGNY